MSFAITDLLLNTGVFKSPAIVRLYQIQTPLRNKPFRIDKKNFRTPNSKSSLIYGLLKDFLLKAVFYFPLKRIFVVSRISFQQS